MRPGGSRFFRRALGLLLGLALAGASITALLLDVGWLSPWNTVVFGHLLHVGFPDMSWRGKTAWAVGSAGVTLLGLLLGALSLRVSPSQRRFVLSKGPAGRLFGGGEVSVNALAVRAMVAHATQRLTGIFRADPSIELRRTGWYLDLLLHVSPSCSLPEVLSEVRPAVRETLLHHTGLPLARLRIFVHESPVARGKRVY